MRYSTLTTLLILGASFVAGSPAKREDDPVKKPANVLQIVKDLTAAAVAKTGQPRPAPAVVVADATKLPPPKYPSPGCGMNCNSTLHFGGPKAKTFQVGNDIPGLPFRVKSSWAGNIPIGNSKDQSLYFWLWGAEKPSKDLVIWLNGGPGCSSLLGMLQEIGPFQYFNKGESPYQNPYSWTKAANILFVDQPVGTGFSTGKPTALDETDIASQFAAFLDNFFENFPELNSNKLWIVGESYAGLYVPYIADWQYNLGNPHNLQGIGIIDGVFTSRLLQTEITAYQFTVQQQVNLGLSDKEVRQVKKVADACGYTDFVEKHLKFPPTEQFVIPDCDYSPQTEFFELVYQHNKCFNIYHITDRCPTPVNVLGDANDPDQSSKPTFFDNTKVKEYINAPSNVDWDLCKRGVFATPNGDDPSSAPDTNGVFKHVVEASKRTFISTGNLDGLIISNGSLLAIQNFIWNGAQGFTKPPTKRIIAEGKDYGRWIEQRNLAYIEYTDAGHENPAYVPAAALKMIKYLLGQVSSMS